VNPLIRVTAQDARRDSVFAVDVAACEKTSVSAHQIDQAAGRFADLARPERIAKDPWVAQSDAPAYVVGQPIHALSHDHAGVLSGVCVSGRTPIDG
jgi:hypothetical protein